MLDRCPTHHAIMHIGCMYRTKVHTIVRRYDGFMTFSVSLSVSLFSRPLPLSLFPSYPLCTVMARSYAATRLQHVSSDPVQMLLPAMRARRRPFFLRVSQFLPASCFTPRPDSGVVTRQVAHVMEAAVLPSRQAQACRCAARGASLPSGQAPSAGPAHRFLLPRLPLLPADCPSAALAVNSLCNQRLDALTQRFSTGLLPKNVDIHARAAGQRALPVSYHFS